MLSTTRVLVPIAFDAAELELDAVLLPEELHAATPTARIPAAMAVVTLGLMDL
ncbi:MAG: hypothetical protein JO037_05925 [Actinobacteria bacterium]|nr:hypothetical protein [Actinomycetota bacterium]